ncbi:hypothetical protein HZS_3636, partial [Henneguya salminicola]
MEKSVVYKISISRPPLHVRAPQSAVNAITIILLLMTATKSSNSESVPLVSGIKYIQFEERTVPIFTQLFNGPCPLIAIVNAMSLLVRIDFKLSPGQDLIELDTLIHLLAQYIINQDSTKDSNHTENYQANIEGSLDILYQIVNGININVLFSGIRDFEFTKEIGLLDILKLDLYHGWIVDPAHATLRELISHMTYNQLMEHICTWGEYDTETPEYKKYIMASKFLNGYPTQLSHYGLKLLVQSIAETKIGVFFRNDHFSTVIRRGRHLLTLVSDFGYQNNSNVVWEIVALSGSGQFLTCDFKIYRTPNMTDSQSSCVSSESKSAAVEQDIPPLNVDTAYQNFLDTFSAENTDIKKDAKHDSCVFCNVHFTMKSQSQCLWATASLEERVDETPLLLLDLGSVACLESASRQMEDREATLERD